MIKSIRIKNFKAIQDTENENGDVIEKPLILSGLTNVNYLVGKNGCGKSSVLEALHCKYLYDRYESDSEYRKLLEVEFKINSCNELLKIFRYDEYCFSNSEIILTQKAEEFSNPNETEGRPQKILEQVIQNKSDKVLFLDNSSEKLLRFMRLLELDYKEILKPDFRKLLVNTFAYVNLSFYFLDHTLEMSSGEFIKNTVPKFAKVFREDMGFGTILIEEFESTFHPDFQKIVTQELIYKIDLAFQVYNMGNPLSVIKKQTQFFISTHSNYLVSEALKFQNQKVYHFDAKGVIQNPEGISSLEIKSFNNMLDTLGAKPSDMLFANGIIWVEGPADIIYIQKWLEMYCSENSLNLFEKGKNYEFAMYGGALLTYLFGDSETKKEDLQNIFKINTRAFVICDSDKKDEFSTDISTYSKAKMEIKEIVGDSNFWCDKLVKTVEEYLLESNTNTWKYDRRCKFEIRSDKPNKAFRRTQLWSEKNIKLNDFAPTLLPNIKKLYKVIESWNKFYSNKRIFK